MILGHASSGEKGLVQSGQFADYMASEQSRKERNIFQQERVEQMDEQAYLAFQQCRLANFMSKGK